MGQALADPDHGMDLKIAPTLVAEGRDGISGSTPPDRSILAWDILESTVGFVMVATTRRGLCFVAIGDSDEAVCEALYRAFPNAPLRREDTLSAPAVAATRAVIDDPQTPVTVPLDIQGTPFQQRVWDRLLRISPGETRSYAELARELDKPRGQRAVARACASNPVAPIIPCHRVVRGDGGLGGYRWGLSRKRELLRREGGPT